MRTESRTNDGSRWVRELSLSMAYKYANIPAISPLVHSRPAVCGTQQSPLCVGSVARRAIPEGPTSLIRKLTIPAYAAPLSPPSRVAPAKRASGEASAGPSVASWVRGEGGVLKLDDDRSRKMKNMVMSFFEALIIMAVSACAVLLPLIIILEW